MEVPWPYDRCILCLGPGPLTKEHIIPDQIGGKLWARFLCPPCNGALGHEVEHSVKGDPAIRLAVEQLKKRMPALGKKIREGQAYVGGGPTGPVRGGLKDGQFRVDTFRAPDGSLIQRTPEARKHIQALLLKSGIDEAQVPAILRRFDQAPANTRVDFAPGWAAIKREGATIGPALDGPLLSPQVLLKIAYEFLACHLAEAAYDTRAQLAEIRDAVAGRSTDPEAYSIEYLTSREYSPVHGLALIGSPHVVVRICLFDWLRFRVHFHRLAVGAPYFAYMCLLDSGDEDCKVLEERTPAEGGAARGEGGVPWD